MPPPRRWRPANCWPFPTETVYGLGARADDDAAVQRIFAAKGRPAAHPLIVHVGRRRAGAALRAPTGRASAQALAQAFWPGPLTLIVPRAAGLAAAAAGGQGSIGLRVPGAPGGAGAAARGAARWACPAWPRPAPTASAASAPPRRRMCVQEFGAALLVLDGGDCPGGIESAIVDCTRGAAGAAAPRAAAARADRGGAGRAAARARRAVAARQRQPALALRARAPGCG